MKGKRYPTDLNSIQSYLVKINLSEYFPRLRKYDPIEILNAIAYVIKTGCQWNMLPHDFPHWKMVYHHFRSWSDREWFSEFLELLVQGRRGSLGQDPLNDTFIVDSQSVRSALAQSEKGIDGNKRIKGIKRHVAVDDNGYVCEATVTTANVHDSKGALPLLADITERQEDNISIRGDLGYLPLKKTAEAVNGLSLECVKSNFGSPDFIPIQGRWVVERTFSWMENYRRLTRNYERLLKVATQMFTAASVFFILRYLR